MRRCLFYLCIALILMVFLVMADPIDLTLSQWLQAHSLPKFANFMDRSLFEGEGFGAGDMAVFVQLTIFGLWIASVLTKAPSGLRQHRSLLAYIVISSILTALCVHLGKGLIARPRPYELGLTLSSWQGLTHRLFHGWGHGSFPSGHTANAISLMAIAYGLQALNYRKLARILGFCVLMFAISMGISRIMIGAHWPTDTLAAATLGWFIAHTRYRAWQVKTENET